MHVLHSYLTYFLSIIDSKIIIFLFMGNCWRMPEDHSGLLHIPSTNLTSSLPTSSTVSSYNSYINFTHSISTTSDTHTPKVICLEVYFFVS